MSGLMSKLSDPLVLRAWALACEAHAGQLYGDVAYTYHLRCVVHLLVSYDASVEQIAAGWLHDCHEDTPVTVDEIAARLQSDTVGRLVWAVTGIGANRKKRNANIYAKLRDLPAALPIKLADRIANGTTGSSASRFVMYRKEYPEFRAALFDIPAEPFVASMWKDLDEIFEWVAP